MYPGNRLSTIMVEFENNKLVIKRVMLPSKFTTLIAERQFVRTSVLCVTA